MFTENLGRMYSEQYDMPVICIRVGKIDIHKVDLAPNDLKYADVLSYSDNPTRYRDIEHVREILGFVP